MWLTTLETTFWILWICPFWCLHFLCQSLTFNHHSLSSFPSSKPRTNNFSKLHFLTMAIIPYGWMVLDGWVSLDTGIVDNEHHRVLLAKEKRLSITGNISLQDTKVHIFGGGCAASKKMTSRAMAYRGWTHETHFLFQPITSFYRQSHCLQPPPTEWDQQGQLGTHRLSLLNSVKLVNIILAQVHFGHPQHQQDQGSRVKDQRSMFQCQENLCTGCFF